MLCPTLGRVGAVDGEILIIYGDDTVGSGSHGVNIFCVLCVKIECRAILGDANRSMKRIN